MPTYEYKCKTCGKEFEITQRITADSLKKCPVEVCENDLKGIGDIERMISKNVSLVFKGTGFYLTDYAKKNVSPNSTSELKTTETKNKEVKSNSSKSEKSTNQ